MKHNISIIILIISILFLGLFNTYELIQEANINQKNQLISDLEETKDKFNKWITTKKVILDTAKDVVDNLHYEDISEMKINNTFLDINNNDEDISEIYIGLSNGEFVTGSDWIPPDDYDPRQREWYIDALSKNKTIFSDIYIDRETGEKLVTISSPLYIDGEIVGVIAADVFLININRYLENNLLEDNSYAYIINENGKILVHTRDKSLVEKSIYNIELKGYTKFFENVKNTSESISGSYTIEGRNVNGVLQKVEGIDWYIGISAEKDIELANIFENRKYFQIITINLLIALLISLSIFNIIKTKRKLKMENLGLTLDNSIDYLTGAYNRRYCEEYLNLLWEESINNTQISALMIDIDHFKKYNDTYGHQKGDEILKTVADTINENIRNDDILVRYGGEEFLILLKATTLEEAKIVAKKIKEAVFDKNIENKNTSLGILTISIGVSSVLPKNDINKEGFIIEADKALYEAKERGRNKVFAYKNKKKYKKTDKST